MADTTESQLQVVLQEIGGNNNTWGTILNNNLQKLVNAIASQTAVAVTGGDTSLTDDQQRSMVLNFTGVLASNQIIRVNDSAEKLWIVRNNTSGNFTLTIQTDTGAGVAVEQGFNTILFSDGTDVVDVQRFLRRPDLYNLKWVGEFGGTADALTATYSDFEAGALAEGVIIWGRAPSENTGAMTLDLNSIGATAIEDAEGNAIRAGVVKAGQIIALAYNATNTSFQLINIFDAFKQNITPTLNGPLNPNGNWIGKDKGSDLASGATVVIGTDGDIFDVTGTTNITAMTVAANRFFLLRFDDAVEIEVGASLELNNSGQNYTTAAGDQIFFYSTAANTVRGMIQRADDGVAKLLASQLGTGANQALQLTSGGKYPALDGSLITGINSNYVHNVTKNLTSYGAGTDFELTLLGTTINVAASSVVECHISLVIEPAANDGVLYIKRNGTEILTQTNGLANPTKGAIALPDDQSSGGSTLLVSYSFIDESPDTGDNEYTIHYRGPSNTIYLNRTVTNANDANSAYGVSTVILKEIKVAA